MIFFLAVYFKLLPKLSNFVNSDDCVGKIPWKSIRLYPVIIEKVLKSIRDRFLPVKIMRNSGNSSTSAIQQFLNDAPRNKCIHDFDLTDEGLGIKN